MRRDKVKNKTLRSYSIWKLVEEMEAKRNTKKRIIQLEVVTADDSVLKAKRDHFQKFSQLCQMTAHVSQCCHNGTFMDVLLIFCYLAKQPGEDHVLNKNPLTVITPFFFYLAHTQKWMLHLTTFFSFLFSFFFKFICASVIDCIWLRVIEHQDIVT